MFEELTAFIPKLQNDSYGKWIYGEKTEDGVNIIPYVSYSPAVIEFTEVFYDFAVFHKELGIMNCEANLEREGISLNTLTPDRLFQLDGKAVASVIMFILRRERFTDGFLLSYLKDASILQCLERLKELDEES